MEDIRVALMCSDLLCKRMYFLLQAAAACQSRGNISITVLPFVRILPRAAACVWRPARPRVTSRVFWPLSGVRRTEK
jgi:hypothetical protein